MTLRPGLARLAAALLLVACDGARSESGSRPGSSSDETTANATVAVEERPEPSRPPAARGSAAAGCHAETAETVLAPAPVVPAIAVASAGEAALIVFPVDGDTLSIRPVDLRGAPSGEARSVDVPAARGLFALRAVGERYVVLTQGACGEEACIAAQLLGGDGGAVGEPLRLPLPSPLLTRRVRETEDALWIARSHEGAEPALDRLVVGPRGLRAERERLDVAQEAEGHRVEVLGLAVDDDRWAVVWRRGAAEAIDSEVVLSTHRAERAVEALHHALVLDALAWEEDTLHAVAGFEMARPVYLRLSAEGAVEAEQTIRHGAPLPAAVADQRGAALRQRTGRLELEIRNAAGDPLGEAVEVAGLAGDVVADVAKLREGFLVVFAGPQGKGWSVAAAPVRCAALHDPP